MFQIFSLPISMILFFSLSMSFSIPLSLRVSGCFVRRLSTIVIHFWFFDFRFYSLFLFSTISGLSNLYFCNGKCFVFSTKNHNHFFECFDEFCFEFFVSNSFHYWNIHLFPLSLSLSLPDRFLTFLIICSALLILIVSGFISVLEMWNRWERKRCLG